MESKILSVFGLGMNNREIVSHVKKLYGNVASTATISAVTNKIIDEVKQVATASAGQPLSVFL